MFRIGLIINPWAGVGGAVGLKGSDGKDTVEKALSLGAEQKAHARALSALSEVIKSQQTFAWLTAGGDMGEDALVSLGVAPDVVYRSDSVPTTARDTEEAAQALVSAGVDLMLFAGGDGTARNVCHAVGEACPMLGIPAGCKIHSGVYAVTPEAAGICARLMAEGHLMNVVEADVMDIDEQAFRNGVVKACRYGGMTVPESSEYVQQVKMGGVEKDEHLLMDIAADVADSMEDDVLYIMGSGGTVEAVMQYLNLPNTLLGVDVVKNRQVIASDVRADQLLALLQGQECRLVITLIGGQGHVFGRGNQQLSPQVIRTIGKENICIVGLPEKLVALNGRPMIADTGDHELDEALAGMYQVVTGYDQRVWYRLG